MPEQSADASSPVRRKWRGVDPEARTAERRQRVIDAAIGLLSTDGLGGTTVRAVCARAGLHSRYFYESFPDIESLLLAVFDQLSGGFLEFIAAAQEAAGPDPADRLRAVLTATAEVVREQAPLVRVIAVEAVGNEELNQRRIRMLHDVAAMIEAEAHRSYGAPPPGERIAAVSARFMAGGLAELFLAWLDGELGGSTDDLAGDAVDVVTAFSESTRRLAAWRAGRPTRPGPGPAGRHTA